MFVMYAGHLDSFCEECFQLVYPEVTNSYKFKVDVTPQNTTTRHRNRLSFVAASEQQDELVTPQAGNTISNGTSENGRLSA